MGVAQYPAVGAQRPAVGAQRPAVRAGAGRRWTLPAGGEVPHGGIGEDRRRRGKARPVTVVAAADIRRVAAGREIDAVSSAAKWDTSARHAAPLAAVG